MTDTESKYGMASEPLIRFRFRSAIVWTAVVVLALALVGSLAVMVARAREAAARNSCNLGGIRLALHNYHDVNGTLPPAATYGDDGEPMHSWRVLILPFIEQRELYDEFRLDEPWDSKHNLRLLERMPSSYEAPWTYRVYVPEGYTVCRVLVGPGAAFEGRDGLRLLSDFPDGAEDTLLFVEAGEPVPWTKPEGIGYQPSRPLRLKGLFRDGFRACSVNGPYRFIRYDADQRSVHAAITRNGQESLSLDW